MSKCVCFRLQVNEPTYISIPIERQREDTFVAVSDIVSFEKKMANNMYFPQVYTSA